MINLFNLNLMEFFLKEDNDFIDIVRHNAQKLTQVKKSIALAAITKACQKNNQGVYLLLKVLDMTMVD